MRLFLNWINAHQESLALIVVCLIIAIVYLLEKKRRVVACLGMSLYIFFVLYKTVLSRTQRITVVNLELGWSYKAIVSGVPGMLSQVYLNIMFFVPIGIFGGVLFLNKKKRSYIFPVVLGLILTITVECFQLILQCGTFEVDDILNNMIGTVIGLFIGVIINRRMKIKRDKQGIV